MRTPFHIRWAPSGAAEQTSPPPPEQAKFRDLLRELFQFDCADLDFGIYRIMNHKRKVVDRYIDQELPGAIEEAVGQGALHTEAERARNFEETRKQMVEVFGEDSIAPGGELLKYQETPLGKKYMLWRERARHSESAGDVRRDIYNHLYAFFSRYYQDGDFVPRRRYSHEHPYVVPYNGEEVHFHWANRDQYYVKAAEHFRDYRYRTRSGVSVRFSLRSANVEQNDVKGQKRFFFPLPGAAVWDEKRRALELLFDYRPLTPVEKKDFGRNGQQDAILQRAEATVPEALASAPEAAKALLDRWGSDAGDDAPTLFAYHADRFARRRTSDFFVHRDLKGFLTRELGYYLKSEVLSLGALEAGGEMRADAWLDKMRVIREVGRNIIEFLAQIEGFQKMLWEKRKFVADVHYCVAVRLIPDELLPDVLACDAQWREWRALGCVSDDDTLFASDDDPGARSDFLKRSPGILLDTRQFDPSFVDGLLAAMDDIDAKTSGVAIKSENWQALRLLGERYRGDIQCVYLDPPYNTDASPIIYKNNYQHSSWASLMENRLSLSRSYMTMNGVLGCAIDENELKNLLSVMEKCLPDRDLQVIVVNHYPGSGSGRGNVSSTHEYYIVAVPSGQNVLVGARRTGGQRERNFRRSGQGENNFRWGRPNSFFAILVDPASWEIKGMEKAVPLDADYPKGRTEEGWLRIYPIGKDGSERVWGRNYESSRRLWLAGDLKCSRRGTITHVIEDTGRRVLTSAWLDKKFNAVVHGTNLLSDILGRGGAFSYPKSLHTVKTAVDAVLGENRQGKVLDYFAGSGTTGHAVIELNREDGGSRRFVLVEMGDHFDTVLLPRLKKVAFSPEWKNGTAKREATPEEAERGPRIIKYFRMESYEDALGNIEFEQEDKGLFGLEDYMLRYMLQWETRGSATLLNVAALDRPFDYKLRLDGNAEAADVAVDLPETFNYLLGLAVSTRRVYDDEGRRYLVYTGCTRDGRSAVVIWRNTEGWTLEDRERDRDFVAAHDMTSGADEIWMNGDSIVKDARPLDTLFKQRMFAPAGG